MAKCWMAACFFLLLWTATRAQRTYNSISRDTIVTINGAFGNQYVLDGKKLNLPVMQWFMTGHPDAYNQVRVANITDQLSLASYTAAGVLLLSGVLIFGNDPNTSRDFYLYGGIAFGSGILLQVFSNSHKKKAVMFYNEDVRNYYRKGSAGLNLGAEGVALQWRF